MRQRSCSGSAGEQVQQFEHSPAVEMEVALHGLHRMLPVPFQLTGIGVADDRRDQTFGQQRPERVAGGAHDRPVSRFSMR